MSDFILIDYTHWCDETSPGFVSNFHHLQLTLCCVVIDHHTSLECEFVKFYEPYLARICVVCKMSEKSTDASFVIHQLCNVVSCWRRVSLYAAAVTEWLVFCIWQRVGEFLSYFLMIISNKIKDWLLQLCLECQVFVTNY